MADFIRRDTAQLLQDVPDATKEAIIGALEVALENREWEEDRDDIYELLLRADVEDAALRCDKLAAAIGLLSDELLNDDDREPAWVSVAVKVFVVCAVAALAIAARNSDEGPMRVLREAMMTVKLALREHAVRAQTVIAALRVVAAVLEAGGEEEAHEMEGQGMEALLRQVQRDWDDGPGALTINCGVRSSSEL